MVGRSPGSRQIRVVAARRRARTENERVWRSRTENGRVWRGREFGDKSLESERVWRGREVGDKSLESERVWRARGFGDQESLETNNGNGESGDLAGGARVPCAKRSSGTPPDFGLWEEGATSQQRCGTQTCRMRLRDQRDGSIRLDGGGRQCVKDKRVKQKPWTLDPMGRVLAGRVQKGNNGSQRPYINPQGASSEIGQSRSVVEKSQSRSVIQHQSFGREH
ncbi:uncharacterized protein LOC127011691 [Drosophila biarmipes]|uniref:uncharacterized protein LOC127011691 n=1 Tax=Drosophila biarmipes TaxID=125945 RepID=UPI0021CCC403|nr:uncharacterized protein LOC127011691 [Drosophila biarmipes]